MSPDPALEQLNARLDAALRKYASEAPPPAAPAVSHIDFGAYDYCEECGHWCDRDLFAGLHTHDTD